jgi:hypothetical protein
MDRKAVRVPLPGRRHRLEPEVLQAQFTRLSQLYTSQKVIRANTLAMPSELVRQYFPCP